MPYYSNSWTTPNLQAVRQQNQAYIQSQIGVPLLPNDVPRVLADANAGNASLAYQYLDFLSLQLLPTTATGVYLDQHASLYLVNADGSLGRLGATYASGTITLTATVAGTLLPAGSQFAAVSGSTSVTLETITATPINLTPTSVAVRSLTAGAIGNLTPSTFITIGIAIPGINGSSAQVVAMSGGADEETDDALRARLLSRLQQPPMGGDASDYVQWALSVPGVTRAWASPNEMGPGTITIRIMCDQIRATSDPMTSGLPTASDIAAVRAYLDTVRPVCVVDYFVLAPVPEPITMTVSNLTATTSVASAQAAIQASVGKMIFNRARPATAVDGKTVPGQTITAARVSDAILGSSGVSDFDLTMTDYVPSNNGAIGVLGSIRFV